MLERLIDTKVYEKLPDSNDHNPNVLTKLLFNYRSHPAIIAMSNNLFYNGDLIAKGNISKQDQYTILQYILIIYS